MAWFEFATAARIIFGPGALVEIGPIAKEFGRRALIVTGGHPDRAGKLVSLLHEQGIETTTFSFAGEPTVESARSGVKAAHQCGSDLVIGFGGGSAIDTGKAIAALVRNGGDPLDYLEGIGTGRALTQPSAPYIAIPTTAGTGAEVTRNAVLGSPEHRVKVSLRSPHMLPRVALIDPELTFHLPPEITATTGMDALTQLIEAFVSNRANPMTDTLCRDGIQRAARSLRSAYLEGGNLEARTDMSLAALYSGIALANARLGAVHGIAGPLGGMITAPHGAICARLLPIVMAANLRAIQERDPGSSSFDRIKVVAQLLTGSQSASVEDGASFLENLCSDLFIPQLAYHGLTESDLPQLIANSLKSSSMQGNPIQLTHIEVEDIVHSAM